MGDVLSKYPVRADNFHKRAYSDGRKSQKAIRNATKQALRSTTGPILEVGGPSEGGFLAIDGLKLRNGLIISNFEKTEGASLMADVRKLPFEKKSLGGILMKGLTRVPEEIARAPRKPGELIGEFSPHLMDDSGNVLRLIFDARDDNYSGWEDESIMAFSQRIALLKEARRTIEPGGIFVATMLSGGELRLAEQLGFELKAVTMPEVDYHALHYNSGEFLMTLSNLDTPAGAVVECSAGSIPLA